MTVTDADVYTTFQAAPARGRQFGWWLVSSDVLHEFAVRHSGGWSPAAAGPVQLLGRPVRVVDGQDVFEFVPRFTAPARKHRKMRLR
jgi:hypothetical protein